ncbi:MAG TPA: hypothetical protein VMP11_09430 [Verrucomicrobiae bacterium]|nr:hypothetical protein [Verrucomicrobiae bacterium]
MHRTRHGLLTATLLLCITTVSRSSHAQYTANFQTNIISGVSSNWSTSYIVGSNTFADTLWVRSGGMLDVQSQTAGCLGYEASSSNNSAVITGVNSKWDTGGMTVGLSGAGNSLVISNQGKVVSWDAGYSAGVLVSSSNNTILISDTGSVWEVSGSQNLGYWGAGNSLIVSNGGQFWNLNSDTSYVGYEISSSNNSLVVTGPGSVWSNNADLYVGTAVTGPGLPVTMGGDQVVVSGGGKLSTGDGAFLLGNWRCDNSLVVSNGGQMMTGSAYVGGDQSSNNVVLITGPGSFWTAYNLQLALGAFHNSLIITNGGRMTTANPYGGALASVAGSGRSNTVLVVDGGVWQGETIDFATYGSSNSLVVDGGAVAATGLRLGYGAPDCNNVIQLDNGSITVTNGGTGVFEISGGALVLNGGTLQADVLVITNPCAQFVHSGGTLIVSNVVLDPNLFRIVSVARQSNDMLITWMMGPGASNTLQVATGAADGSYNANGFTDVFVVTNNPTLGTVTNYLDVGAAMSGTTRYYRARLAP